MGAYVCAQIHCLCVLEVFKWLYMRQLSFTLESAGKNILAEWTLNHFMMAVKDCSSSACMHVFAWACTGFWKKTFNLEGYSLKGWGRQRLQFGANNYTESQAHTAGCAGTSSHLPLILCGSVSLHILQGNEVTRFFVMWWVVLLIMQFSLMPSHSVLRIDIQEERKEPFTHLSEVEDIIPVDIAPQHVSVHCCLHSLLSVAFYSMQKHLQCTL